MSRKFLNGVTATTVTATSVVTSSITGGATATAFSTTNELTLGNSAGYTDVTATSNVLSGGSVTGSTANAYVTDNYSVRNLVSNFNDLTHTINIGTGSVTNNSNYADKYINIGTGNISGGNTYIYLGASGATVTLSGTVILPSTTSIGSVSSTEIGYVDGVTSAIQTQLDGRFTYPPFASGGYYSSAFHGRQTSNAGTLNTTHYTAIYVGATTSFDRIGTYTGTVTTAGTVRLGIYSDLNGAPNSRILDAGTVAFSSSTSPYLITINQSLSPGWYWLAFNMQSGTSNFLSFQTASQPQGNQRMYSNTANTSVSGFTQGSVSGAFPATATPVANASNTALNLAYLRAT